MTLTLNFCIIFAIKIKTAELFSDFKIQLYMSSQRNGKGIRLEARGLKDLLKIKAI